MYGTGFTVPFCGVNTTLDNNLKIATETVKARATLYLAWVHA